MIFKIFFISIALFVVFASHHPEVFKINLDLPSEERFKEVILAKRSQIQAFSKVFFEEYPEYLLPNISSFEDVFSHQKEFYDELKGVAKYSNLSLKQALALNFIYEILASCTSIITIDLNGNLIHGRNLDYHLGTFIANFTVHLLFYKNGSLLYEGDGNAGFLGIATGLKKGSFAISLNQRKGEGDIRKSMEIILKNNIFPIPYFMRNVMEKAKDFESAVKMLSSQEFAAPAYVIVSGVNRNEGVVITRNRSGVQNITQIKENNTNEWYLVQTNYDRDVPDPIKDLRRLPAEERIREIGRNKMSMGLLFDKVISIYPNHNAMTITSGVICAKTGEFNITVW